MSIAASSSRKALPDALLHHAALGLREKPAVLPLSATLVLGNALGTHAAPASHAQPLTRTPAPRPLPQL
eukprot:5459502-Pleurochrysis_carterae.AAC.1